MYRTARKHGNLHILNKEQTMSEISMTTGEFETGWVHLAKEDDFGGYNIEMLFKSGSKEAKELIAAIEKADLTGGDGHIPIKLDADQTAIKAKSKFEVKVVDSLNKTIPASEIWQSDICRARVKIRPYDARGNKGVSVLLNAVQKIANGESREEQVEEWFPQDGSSAKKETGRSPEANDFFPD
jgi:hypothetical protein